MRLKAAISTFRIYLTMVLWLFLNATSFAQYDSIPHGGYERTYLLHLPTGYSEADSMPLIIAMHGGFGNAFNLENQSQLSVKADAENFMVVYPEGVEGGFFNISSWNAGWCCGYSSSSNIGDVGFINTLLDTLISKYSIDTNRIYATGMSNGGFMSYRLACELSARIAAIAPVAASMSMTTCTPVRPVPVIEFHSYLDENVPYLGGIGSGPSDHYNPPQDSVLNVWANLNSCSVINDTVLDNAQYTFIIWRDCDCNSEIQQYITQDGGHSWPGGMQTATGDPVSNYINATDLMWTFFKQYSLDCTTSSIEETYYSGIDFELFPNPSTGIVKLRISGSVADFTATVYNHQGRLILSSENSEVFNLTDQPAGVYIIIIRTENQVLTQKIIKTK